MSNTINHIGVIMDGNRRWAKIRNIPTIEGHTKGAWNLFYLCDWCLKRNIGEVSVYVFSTYNWNRTDREIKDLFNLVEKIFLSKINDCIEKGIKINLMGNLAELPISLQKVLILFKEKTQNCKAITLNIAINYGGQEDIVNAVKRYNLDKNKIEDLTIENIRNYLYCKKNIDLVIRSGGYKRLSNFMIWQTACAEFYFTDVLWPDFTEDIFAEAIKFYYNTTINNGK